MSGQSVDIEVGRGWNSTLSVFSVQCGQYSCVGNLHRELHNVNEAAIQICQRNPNQHHHS